MRAARASEAEASGRDVSWPLKREVFGVRVSVTDYDAATDAIMHAAGLRIPAIVDHMSVHGLADGCRNPSMRSILNDFDIVAPDGHSVRWALNRYAGTALDDRVYGPELMQRLLARAAADGVSIYLYGGSPDVAASLRVRLLERWPDLRLAGCESPPFRELTPAEDRATVDRINHSGAGLVFLGLGCPKQELFAHEHRDRIRAVQLCVGAAFDFLSGAKPMAPRWVQDRGLEWLYRLVSEPRRLWRRYAVCYAVFWIAAARTSMRLSRSRQT